jgi:pimeloyl-ACP methyl ester carboxylesterase
VRPAETVTANGVNLCVQTIGDHGDPAVLLIAGATGSMLSWDDEFCGRLAAGGRLVIRFDQRDTGRSVTYPAGQPAYVFDDLVSDVIGILDAIGIDEAHLAGVSMGAAIAGRTAVMHPSRVASLTLIAMSPDPSGVFLPPMSDLARARFSESNDTPPPWTDRAAIVERIVRSERSGAAQSRAFDESARRAVAERVVDRANNIESSMTNHWIVDRGVDWGHRLDEIRAPTLVLHGTEDPLFSLEHGIALSKLIPLGRLMTLERTGHEVPPPETLDVVIPAILAHTQGTDS